MIDLLKIFAWLESDSESRKLHYALAILRERSLTLAIRSQTAALAREASKSLARRRLRLSQARVRSTTQRRGSSVKPCASAARLTISRVQSPRRPSAVASFAPA